MNNNYQRKDAISNTQVGIDFENKVYQYFLNKGISLKKQMKVPIGINAKKDHAFDLGNDTILVECKSQTWTESGNVPSAKIKNWSDAMFSFYLAPKSYKKFFIVEMSFNQNKCQSLLEYFMEHYYYLIPEDVILVDYYTDNDYLDFYVYDKETQMHMRKMDFRL